MTWELKKSVTKTGNFGGAVTINGNYAMASRSNTNDGEVYFYLKKNDGSWSEEQKITSSGSRAFGYSIDIDGNYAIITDYFVGGAGSVSWYFRESDGVWREQQKIPGTGGFGFNCSISGNNAIVSADSTGEEVYFYLRNNSGKWEEIKKISGYGYVSMSGNGAMVGDFIQSTIYFYHRGDDGLWKENKSFTIGTPPNFASGSGIFKNYAVTVAPDDNEFYFYERDNSGKWLEKKKIPVTGLTSGSVDIYENYATASSATQTSLYLKNNEGDWKLEHTFPSGQRSSIYNNYIIIGDSVGGAIHIYERKS